MNSYNLPSGIIVKDYSLVHECFSIEAGKGYSTIRINVSAENIERMFLSLCKPIQTAGFMVFEHGTNQKIENKIRTRPEDPFHIDVNYIDNIDYNKMSSIFQKYRDLLVNDGQINFGYGAHESQDEVCIGAYKIFYIYCTDVPKYKEVLIENGFQEEERIKTLWDCFNQDNPGQRRLVELNGKRIYDMIDELKPEGLYFAERRES